MSKASSPISWEEYSTIATSLQRDGMWRELLLFALGGFTAYRVSDYNSLTWGYLLNAGNLDIIERKGKWLGKAARRVELNDELKGIIEQCRQKLNPYSIPDWPLFRGARGPRAQNLTRMGVNLIIKRAATKYIGRGDISAHSLRKCFARHVYETLGANHEAVLVVQAMLGHSNYQTTTIYLGITQDIIKKAYQGLSIYGNRQPVH